MTIVLGSRSQGEQERGRDERSGGRGTEWRNPQAVWVDRPGRPLHLTTRGRLLIIGFVVVAVVLAFGLGRASAAPKQPPQPGSGVVGSGAVVVGPHETLWSIATRVAPQADPRATVAELTRLNHLGSTQLVPGQVLRLP